MLIVRPVRKDDLAQLYDLSAKTTVGMTTFPHDRAVLEQRIKKAVQSFTEMPSKPGGEIYIFVLEDQANKKVIGTSAIFSKVGGFTPSYTYRVEQVSLESKFLKTKKNIRYLKLIKDYNGPTEIGMLFVDPQYRNSGTGRLIALSRFLFMAQYRQCFEHAVMAEIRGIVDEHGRSSFWEAVGRHFFDMEFGQADSLVMKDRSFIADLMPEFPIYIPLLPADAQDVIGKIKDDAVPAVRLLESEGFAFANEVDIFEAGPTYSAQLNHVRTVKESQSAQISEITDSAAAAPEFLIANADSFSNFRVAAGTVTQLEKGHAALPSDVANAIQVKLKSKIRFVKMKGGDDKK